MQSTFQMAGGTPWKRWMTRCRSAGVVSLFVKGFHSLPSGSRSCCALTSKYARYARSRIRTYTSFMYVCVLSSSSSSPSAGRGCCVFPRSTQHSFRMSWRWCFLQYWRLQSLFFSKLSDVEVLQIDIENGITTALFQRRRCRKQLHLPYGRFSALCKLLQVAEPQRSRNKDAPNYSGDQASLCCTC